MVVPEWLGYQSIQWLPDDILLEVLCFVEQVVVHVVYLVEIVLVQEYRDHSRLGCGEEEH